MANSLKGRKQLPEQIKKRVNSFKLHLKQGLIKPGMLGKKQSSFQKQRAREVNLGNKHSLGRVLSLESRAKLSQSMIGNRNWESRDPNERVISKEGRKKMAHWLGKGSSNKGTLYVPRENRLCKCGCGLTFVCKVNSGKQFLTYGHVVKTTQHLQNVLKAIGQSPNKFERDVRDLLNKRFPNRFKFVGDGKMIIGGKSPDFVDINNKIVIQCNGIYWHLMRFDIKVCRKNKKLKEREESIPFKRAGYKVHFIWEDDFYNL